MPKLHRHSALAALWLRYLLLLPLVLQGLGVTPALTTALTDTSASMHCTEHAASHIDASTHDHAPTCCEHLRCDCTAAPGAWSTPSLLTLDAAVLPITRYALELAGALPTRVPAPQLRPPIA